MDYCIGISNLLTQIFDCKGNDRVGHHIDPQIANGVSPHPPQNPASSASGTGARQIPAYTLPATVKLAASALIQIPCTPHLVFFIQLLNRTDGFIVIGRFPSGSINFQEL